MPAVTEPPGLLMYSQMSFPGSSASRYRSCAQSWLATSSLTSWPSITMRLFSRRLKMSYCGLMVVGSKLLAAMIEEGTATTSDMAARLPPPSALHPAEHDRHPLAVVDLLAPGQQPGQPRGAGGAGVDVGGRGAQLVRLEHELLGDD